MENCLKGATPCTVCKGTASCSDFSRGEEILSGVLDLFGIEFVREYPIIEQGHRVQVDFFLPSEKVFIEYDSKQHRQGRKQQGKRGEVSWIAKMDSLRDTYAKEKGIKMVRINEYSLGRKIVTTLANKAPELPIYLHDPGIDKIVKEVYDYGSTHYGWNSYEDIKGYADLAVSLGTRKAHDKCGRSMSRLEIDKGVIYG